MWNLFLKFNKKQALRFFKCTKQAHGARTPFPFLSPPNYIMEFGLLKLWNWCCHVGAWFCFAVTGSSAPSRIQNGGRCTRRVAAPHVACANQSAPSIPGCVSVSSVSLSLHKPEVKGRCENRSNGLAERIKAKRKYDLFNALRLPKQAHRCLHGHKGLELVTGGELAFLGGYLKSPFRRTSVCWSTRFCFL